MTQFREAKGMIIGKVSLILLSRKERENMDKKYSWIKKKVRIQLYPNFLGFLNFQILKNH